MENKTKKVARYLCIGALGLATYLGTLRNNSGLPFFYNHITKDSSGICLGLVNKIAEGVNYNGLVLSLINLNGGKINGIEGAILTNASMGKTSEVIGLELAYLGNLQNNPEQDEPSATKGFQVGLFNRNRTPQDCFRIGFEYPTK